MSTVAGRQRQNQRIRGEKNNDREEAKILIVATVVPNPISLRRISDSGTGEPGGQEALS